MTKEALEKAAEDYVEHALFVSGGAAKGVSPAVMRVWVQFADHVKEAFKAGGEWTERYQQEHTDD